MPDSVGSGAKGSTVTVVETGRYKVVISTDPAMLDRVFSLRYEIFNIELGEGLAESHRTKRDTDRFDKLCDHLIVIDTEADVVVGTYRLLAGRRCGLEGFYTATEFDLSSLAAIEGFNAQVVELGRSCIHPDHRTGKVLRLLWDGIASYMTRESARYLVGCGSLHTHSPRMAQRVYEHIQSKGLVWDRFRILPNPANLLSKAPRDESADPITDEQAGRNIPPLLDGYFRVGAKVCGPPAYDPVFRCFDFAIVMDRTQMPEMYYKLFFEHAGEE